MLLSNLSLVKLNYIENCHAVWIYWEIYPLGCPKFYSISHDTHKQHTHIHTKKISPAASHSENKEGWKTQLPHHDSTHFPTTLPLSHLNSVTWTSSWDSQWKSPLPPSALAPTCTSCGRRMRVLTLDTAWWDPAVRRPSLAGALGWQMTEVSLCACLHKLV